MPSTSPSIHSSGGVAVDIDLVGCAVDLFNVKAMDAFGGWG
jgi:hypothetical protein